ncbi:MAG: L,D-transpeptidase [Gammaproteobacteria bacterium]|nr:L,D-transpeptidase [Gammaproteobacteria bacterium]
MDILKRIAFGTLSIIFLTIAAPPVFAAEWENEFSNDSVSSYNADQDYYSSADASAELEKAFPSEEFANEHYQQEPPRKAHRRIAKQVSQQESFQEEDEYMQVADRSRMSRRIASPGEKLIVVDPHTHSWAAYSSSGQLLRSGIASAGANWCPDIGRSCRTRSGSFRIFSLGSRACKSSRYPLPRGGAPMPYCMFFNGNQGLHGSNQLARRNMSHGCVRISVEDAYWLRHNFATQGTKVIVKPY